MIRSSRHRAIALAVAAAGIAGTIAIGTVGSAEPVFTGTAAIAYQPAGYLAIETDPVSLNGRVVYYKEDGTSETLSLGVTKAAKCRVNTTGISDLLGISVTDTDPATAETVGLVSNGLGVRTKNTCSTDSGRVAPGQTISFSLEGTRFGQSYRISHATFDIEGKQNAVVSAAAVGRDGTEDSYGLALESSKASDNGPDAGAGDNSNELVGSPSDANDDFRSITFTSTAASGQFAIEGGGDYGTALATIQANSSKLYLVKQVYGLDCGESVLVNGGGDQGNSAVDAEFRRLENGPKSPTCEVVGVELEIRDAGVYFDNSPVSLDSGAPQDVRAEVVVEWTPEAAQMPMPATQINYEGDENGPREDVKWCGDAILDGTGQIVDWTHPLDSAGNPVPWCLIDQQFLLQGDGSVQRIEVYHGQGDPMLFTKR